MDSSSSAACCYRSVIVLDFAKRETFRRCPVHGETDHDCQSPRRLTWRRRWQLRLARRRLGRFA